MICFRNAALARNALLGAGVLALTGFANGTLLAQVLTVKASVNIQRKAGLPADNSGAVVWLKPIDQMLAATAGDTSPKRKKILQQNKHFDPHVLAVEVGTVVDFPNLDPFFHNVFSLFDGKRFDLGLYEAGTSRSVTFTHTGVCFLFCNIHPEMSGIVAVVDTPYFAVSGRTGELRFPGIPAGRYTVSVWQETATPERPAEFPREIFLSESSPALVIRLVETGQITAPHKNKYGKDYDPKLPESAYPK